MSADRPRLIVVLSPSRPPLVRIVAPSYEAERRLRAALRWWKPRLDELLEQLLAELDDERPAA